MHGIYYWSNNAKTSIYYVIGIYVAYHERYAVVYEIFPMTVATTLTKTCARYIIFIKPRGMPYWF